MQNGRGLKDPFPTRPGFLGLCLENSSEYWFVLSQQECLSLYTAWAYLCFYPALSQNLISLSLGQVPALPLLNPETLQLLVTSFTKVFGLNQKMCINSSAQRLALGTYSVFVRCFCDASIQPYVVLAMLSLI